MLYMSAVSHVEYEGINKSSQNVLTFSLQTSAGKEKKKLLSVFSSIHINVFINILGLQTD